MMTSEEMMFVIRLCMLDILLGLLCTQHIGAVTDTFIATECFGSVLSLSCKPGHRIKVKDDFFGLSTGREGANACQYVPGDCTVTNNRYTSVIHRYCEGKESCTSFQVDRRDCGANQTNYEQVEYQCVPDVDITDICTSTSSYVTDSGYISTPNFPNEYPPNLHCTCSLTSLEEQVQIRLDFTHFIIKYDYPCKDWVEIAMDGQTRRLCGAYRSTLLSDALNLTFHSDGFQGHQGLWLHFSAYPEDSVGKIQVMCGPSEYITTTVTTPTTSTTSQPQTTRELIILYEEPTTTITTTTQTSSPATTLPSSSKPGDLWTISNHIDNQDIKDGMAEAKTDTFSVKYLGETPYVTFEEDFITSDNTEPEHKADLFTAPPNDMETKSVPPDSNLPPASPQTPPSHPKLGKDPQHPTQHRNSEQQRRNNRMTGIIIISVCVGGIVILILILGILLCVNKKQRPPAKSEKRQARLQQRMNSLSFYDSIPLYDSISRKVGVARAPPVDNMSNSGSIKIKGGHTLGGRMECAIPWKADGPYWANMQEEADSDHDSAVYAELDKSSRGDPSEGGTPKHPRELPTLSGKLGPDFAVSLKTQDQDKNGDVYTHV